jgi:hypothetical protein
MTTPSDPRHGASAAPQGNPSTQEIPAVPPASADQAPGGPSTGATRAGALPAPGQQPPQPVVPQPIVPHQPAAAAAPPPPAWPDTLVDEPSPATRPATVLDGVQPTGPVDFVPGLPGAGTPPPTARRRPAAPRNRAALVGLGLAVLSVVLLQLGLLNDDADLWSRVTLWAVFATAATVLGVVALGARAAGKLSGAATTRSVAAAVLGVAVFWLLVVLPIVASDPGFLVTAALLALGGALWVGPDKDRGAADRSV